MIDNNYLTMIVNWAIGPDENTLTHHSMSSRFVTIFQSVSAQRSRQSVSYSEAASMKPSALACGLAWDVDHPGNIDERRVGFT